MSTFNAVMELIRGELNSYYKTIVTAIIPTDLRLHQKSRILEIHFEDGSQYELPCEYLRVFSPSAEVLGHGPGQEVLQTGKEDVSIVAINPVGNYAVCLIFSDGHDTGIYTWEWLYDLAINYQERWNTYLNRLKAEGYIRQQPRH